METALRRGIDLSDLRAHLVTPKDFSMFDYLLAMDRNNFQDLSAVCPRGAESRLRLFMKYAPHLRMREVPDPYFEAAGSFERVFELVEAASAGLLADIKRRFPSILGPV